MTLRKTFFWLHLGVGLAAGAFLASMAVSGILMSFAPQILAWSERGVSRTAPAGGPRQELAPLLSAAAEAAPGARPASFTLYRDPAAASLVGLGEDGAIYLDPRSGSVLGAGSPARAFFESVEHWHRWLGSREIGKPFTGASALGLVFLSLSGLWLWRPRGLAGLKAALTLRSGLGGRARELNRHHAIGFWTSPLLLVIALTGTVMAYRWAGNLLFTLTGGQAPKEAGAPRGGEAKPAQGGSGKEGEGGRNAYASGNLHVSLDSLAAWAGAQAPAWTALTLRAPRKPGSPWSGILEEPGFAAFPRRSQFSLDGGTGAVSKWQPFAEQPAGRKLRAWTTPLHTGRGFGWPGQALAALAAIALLSQIWTGGRMAWRRFSRRNPAPPAGIPADARIPVERPG
jgi:uncharacterized iron-regulated membrane protein